MDTSQFWIEERDLTSDSGFLIFGLKHCVVLIIILLFLVSFTICCNSATVFTNFMFLPPVSLYNILIKSVFIILPV